MSELTSPGEVTLPVASEVLVLAPHYDDETLGCGGLLIRLARSGASVRILFLTDSSAGSHDQERKQSKTERRRAESQKALAVLGLGKAGTLHLDLPDGRLADSLQRVAESLARELEERPPQILLCPSPLEASRDHRAAFAAVHRLLSGLRPGDVLEEALKGLRVFLYEINRPAYPNILVDVGAELETLERAIRCYESQLEEHDYLGAALGLRRYRKLSLDPVVEAAEGYRQLSCEDFQTRSLDRLIRELGGSPELVKVSDGPSITVIVRTRDRPQLLPEALASIAASTYMPLDVLVVNDGGASPDLPSEFPFPIRVIDLEENRGRAAAAQAGIEEARGAGVSFLDDDDLVEPEHYATLAGLLGSSGVRVAYTDAAVAVYEPGGDGWTCTERRLPYSRDFDADRLLLDNYIPFHTLIFERRLMLEIGPFDEGLAFFEDWEMLIRLAQVTAFHHLARVTCEYRHFRGSSHHILGNDPRSRADFLAMKARIYRKHGNLLGPDLLARAVDDLRAEAVQLQETASSSLRQRVDIEEAFHRQRGELASVQGDRGRLQELELVLRAEIAAQSGELARLDTELARVYGEEHRLNELAETRLGVVQDLQIEVQRLQDLIATMESSRVWRWSAWWRRLRS